MSWTPEIFYSLTVWYTWCKYETYNDWGFRQTDGETDIIILLSHLLMEEHLKKTCLGQVFLASSNKKVGFNSKCIVYYYT